MPQYGFHFDGQRCTGCKTCQMACKDYNDLAPDVTLRRVFEYGGGSWEQDGSGLWSANLFTYFVSMACNHCDDPACLTACPQNAISKSAETGLVTRDIDLCIGCGACATACPYGAPKVDPAISKSVKCDGCANRVEQGLSPICVQSCPARALDFGPIDELREKYGDVAEIAPLPSAEQTGPNLVITAPRDAREVGSEDGTVANVREIA
ncbi:MAG: dimethylsulfoxide reductase subunit B [Coriobacteriia bacterium]|nr:dimethylsulfoxide reductase subunit B [Coriobacteriia bacterium]MBS5477849.1 dimethylsulfoxide reductase subunit B [Coriobacteriia bacterium]